MSSRGSLYGISAICLGLLTGAIIYKFNQSESHSKSDNKDLEDMLLDRADIFLMKEI